MMANQVAAVPANALRNQPMFRTLEQEVTLESLKVTGKIPEWLSGTLFRNGPGQFAVGKTAYRHWFDGLAMLHAFAFQNGRVSYANKFIRGSHFTEAREQGEIAFGEFATDPCRSLFARFMANFTHHVMDNANVNVGKIADHYVALTETPMPVAFDPETLETLGHLPYQDQLAGQLTTAHMLDDPGTGETFNYVTHMGRTSRYRIYRLAPNSRTRELVGSIPVEHPAYMHSFALTEHYVVLTEFPFVVKPLDLALGTRPFIENFRWEPERGTRMQVVRRADGKLVGTYTAPAFFAFHHVNAFEADGAIYMDIAAYDNPSMIDAFYLDHPVDQAWPQQQFRRYRVPLNGGPVTCEVISPVGIELPRVNDERNTRPYRYAYGIGSNDLHQFDGLIAKVDVVEHTAKVWAEAGCHPGEPVFVATPGAAAEDDGVVLAVVLDERKGTSFLLVLDAGSFSEIGRAEVPHQIPAGFHGQYMVR